MRRAGQEPPPHTHTLSPLPQLTTHKTGESRSLKAAFELIEAGWSAGNMRHVEGGYQQWRYKGLPTESDE